MSSSSEDSSSEDEQSRRARELLSDPSNCQPMPEMFPGMKWNSQVRREMFENLFGGVSFGSEATNPPADNKECLDALSIVVSEKTATERHEEIQRGCRGMINHHPSTLLGIVPQKHTEGNNLFQAGRFAEALKKYKKMMKESPYDQRYYSNSALCYIRLGKFEKAIAVVSDAMNIVAESWGKGHLVYASAYCHLGYVSLARSYIKMHANLFTGADRLAAKEKIEEIAKGLPMAPKSLDNDDLKATINRLLSSNVSETELTFILIHLQHHFHANPQFCTGIMLPAVVKSINRCQVLNNLLRTKLDIEKIPLAHSRILYLFFTLLCMFAHCCPSCAEELIRQPVLVSYLVDTGLILATRTGMKAILRKQQFGQALAINYAQFMVAISGHESIRNLFLQKTYPFNEFTWHTSMQAAIFCIMRFEDSFASIIVKLTTQEPWFLQRLERMTSPAQKNEISCGLAFMSSLSRFDFNHHDESGSYLPFWVKVSGDRRTNQLCALRPGVWTHFTRRLDYYCEQLKTSSKFSTDIEMALKVLDNMLTTLKRQEPNKKEIIPLTKPEVDNINILSKALVFLVNCKRHCPKMSQTSVISVRTDAFKLIARFAACSLQFRQAVYGTTFSVADIVSACTSEELSRIPGSAIYCLAMFLRLSKNLNTVYNELAELPNLPTLVTRLINFISSMHETDIFSNACLALSYLLAMRDRVKKRVVAALSFVTIEETKRATAFISKLVSVITTENRRAGPRSKSMPLSPCVAALSAGVLLPAVLSSERSYRRILRKVELEDKSQCIPALSRVISSQEESELMT